MDSDLYLALVDDYIAVLKRKDWIQVRDQLTPSNNTVLHLACQHGSTRCVEEILERADESLLLKINSRGETALHLAARQGHYDAAEALINKSKSSDSQVPNNIENTSLTILQNLIRAPNVEFETALHAAVRYNHEKVAELLVKEDPTYSYSQNKYDETPLYLAAVRGYGRVTKVILDNCQLPTFGGPDGQTALHAAATSNAGVGCMIILLQRDEDLIKIADNNGWTAFHFAAQNNLFYSFKLLLDVDKSVAYLADKKYKKTALHVAAYNGSINVIEKLLEYLPDVWDSVDGNGQNILHIAVKQNKDSIIKFILSNTRRFDTLNTLFIQRDIQGNTPLHLIAKFEYYIPELQEWIQKTDRDMVNDTNLTPPDMIHKAYFEILTREDLMNVIQNRDNVYSMWESWTHGKLLKIDEDHKLSPKEKIRKNREMANSHMIVAALITTVALTAGFAMPGGFDGNQGANQGSAVLLRNPAFKTFIVADTVALVFSISSLFLYFSTSFRLKTRVIYYLLGIAIALNVVSIAAMMVAFIAGTFAVLAHSKVLAISVCSISSLFLLLVFSFCVKSFKTIYRPLILQLWFYLHSKYTLFTNTLNSLRYPYFRKMRNFIMYRGARFGRPRIRIQTADDVTGIV